MTPYAVITSAIVSLSSNKLRAGLTLVGILIGVAAFITLMAIGRGAERAITDRIESLGSNLLFVNPTYSQDGDSRLTLEDAEALKDPVFAPAVANVSPELNVFGRLVYRRQDTGSPILGVTPSYESVHQSPVASGQFIAQQHWTTGPP